MSTPRCTLALASADRCSFVASATSQSRGEAVPCSDHGATTLPAWSLRTETCFEPLNHALSGVLIVLRWRSSTLGSVRWVARRPSVALRARSPVRTALCRSQGAKSALWARRARRGLPRRSRALLDATARRPARSIASARDRASQGTTATRAALATRRASAVSITPTRAPLTASLRLETLAPQY